MQVKFITDKGPVDAAHQGRRGENATADLLLTVDAGNLWQAEQMGILQPFASPVIDKNIPLQYRSSAHAWTGLSCRARTIAYSTDQVKPGDLTTTKPWPTNNGKAACACARRRSLQPVADRHLIETWRGQDRRNRQGLGPTTCPPT